MKLLLFCLISILLFSCASPDRTGQIETLKVLQNATNSQFAKGQEDYSNIRWEVKSKRESEVLSTKYNEIMDFMTKTNNLSSPLISKLNNLRSEVINLKSGQKERENEPIELNYTSKLTFHKSALPSEKDITEIIQKIETYRDGLSQLIVESYPDYSFVKPQFSKFNNEKQKKETIDSELKRSKINEDHLHGVTQIMNLLTKQHDTWRAMLSQENWVDYSMSLLSIQNIILQTRCIALRIFNMRVGCRADFNLTNISPIIIGSSNALPNDTVQFQVFLAAYNEYVEHDFTISSGSRLTKIEKGKGFIETVVPASGEVEITGTIEYLKKSGETSSIPWSHKINVIKEN